MTIRKHARVLVGVLAVATSGTLGLASTSARAQENAAVHTASASQPIFTVMNTSETPPDGIWFRNSPHTADVSRITGYGVYRNEQVQLECYASGDAVGRYNNQLWYYVQNVSRPFNNGVSNQGYLNAHYINDGKLANQLDGGVPQCEPQSVYFSGTGDPTGGSGHPVANSDYPSSALLKTPTCPLASGVAMPPDTTTLAGWSGGRHGVIDLLASASPAQYAAVREIIFIDPGNSSEFVPCDAHDNVNALLAKWLQANPQNQLLVITGLRSEEKTILGYPIHRYGKSTFHGLWKYYLAGIWNQPFAGQALVCDYNSADHAQIMKDSWGVVQFPPAGCPILGHESLPVPWHP